MNAMFYSKLAFTNIKRNAKTYIPYIITCIFTVAMFYMIFSLSINTGLRELYGGDIVGSTLGLGSCITAIFAGIFLFYTNSFLMKRRKREFGLFNILGMEKKHLAKIVALETSLIALSALMIGILLGVSFDKLLYLAVLKFIGGEVPMGFYISYKAIIATCILFAIIFFLIFLYALRQLHLAKPIALLQSENAGEKEPKARWFLALLGILCLGSGYYISLTTYDPVAALMFFFVAVILVIIGTYLLFTTGSIAFLKLLRKNKRYYYKTAHFINVSGMLYRMKQNAVGLANICILITMVLVMISSTSSLIIGIEDVIAKRYPTDISITLLNASDEYIQVVLDKNSDILEKHQLTPSDIRSQAYLNFAAIRKDNTLEIRMPGTLGTNSGSNPSSVYIVTLADYVKNSGRSVALEADEILIYHSDMNYAYDNLQVAGSTFKVKEKLDTFHSSGFMQANVMDEYCIVVKDEEQLVWFKTQQENVYKENASSISYEYTYNLSGTSEEKTAFSTDLSKRLYSDDGTIVRLEELEGSRIEITAMYGGFFFIGVFLGSLFIMATILIIYYKQISEGYDDKKRFEIMQKVGLSHTEVKKSIHSQIMIVFFLPLMSAGMHVAFAFPVISRILNVLNLSNQALYIWCTIGCFIAFACVYACIYMLTSKTYYRIVK